MTRTGIAPRRNGKMKDRRFVYHGMFWVMVVVFLIPALSSAQLLVVQERGTGIEPLGAPGVESVLRACPRAAIP